VHNSNLNQILSGVVDKVLPHQSEHDVASTLAFLSTSLGPEIEEEAGSDETLSEAGTKGRYQLQILRVPRRQLSASNRALEAPK
jgi:hypothetical protein